MPWWYGIDIDPTDPSSLCQLLGIDTDEQYQLFLTSLQFTQGKGIIRNKLDHIARSTNSDIQWIKQRVKRRNHYFLHIGMNDPDVKLYTPKIQFALESTNQVKPPRIHRNANKKFVDTWSFFPRMS